MRKKAHKKINPKNVAYDRYNFKDNLFYATSSLKTYSSFDHEWNVISDFTWSTISSLEKRGKTWRTNEKIQIIRWRSVCTSFSIKDAAMG